jgi:C-terminal processing protease CtpA/Prc
VNIKKSGLALLVIGIAIQACSPAPRHLLTTEEKAADLYWVYSQFGENYAPLEMKQALHSLNYEEMKKKYLMASEQTRTNEEFYNLFYSFVAEFRDAHTAGNIMDASLPERTYVAYLGFSGVRKGGALVVTDLLPTIATDSFYPIKSGDIITHLDGAPLSEIVRAQFVPTRNLGQDEANLTYHMNRIFNRISNKGGLPEASSVRVTYVRQNKSDTLQMPWVIKDLYAFASEQAEAVKKKAEAEKAKGGQAEVPAKPGEISEKDALFSIGLQILNGNFDVMVSLLRKTVRASSDFRFWDTFQFIDTLPTWTSGSIQGLVAEAGMIINGKKSMDTDPNALEKQRKVPQNVTWVKEAKTFPTYISLEKEMRDGVATGKTKRIATMYLNTFSPLTAENEVVAEVSKTLEVLEADGVQDLIIDLINNGGGSLSLGMRIAQLLSNEKMLMPDIQFRLSESWIDQFESMSQKNGSPSDSEREIARRVTIALKEDYAKGMRLSRRFNAETLAPFQIRPHQKTTRKLNIALLTNEMCASMCDIFTAVLKDNRAAWVVGAQTMGAGGNVVTHFQSPNAHFILGQTESLILRADGSYIENKGVQADVEVAVNETVLEKYEPVRKKAVATLLAL